MDAPFCPCLLSVAGIDTLIKTNLTRKEFIWFIGYSPSYGQIWQGALGRNLGERAEAETKKEHCLQPYDQADIHLPFSYSSEPHWAEPAHSS